MEAAILHPSAEEWKRLQDESLDLPRKKEILNHVLECEFCQEIWRTILTIEQIDVDADIPITPKTAAIAARLYRRAFRGQHITLRPFDEIPRGRYLMAADGAAPTPPDIENLGEAYCPDPDVVLRLMRNNQEERTYFQLVSNNPALYAGVLVQSSLLGQSFVTDDTGCADVALPAQTDIAKINWMLKLPDAEFELEPLDFDPTDDHWSTVLEVDHGGRIRLTLEKRGSARFLKLDILALDGQPADTPLTAAISVDSRTTTQRAGRDNPILVPFDAVPMTVNIRIYR